MTNIYHEHGYENREEYLASLAEEYGVSLESIIRPMARNFETGEHFDGLVKALDNFTCREV